MPRPGKTFLFGCLTGTLLGVLLAAGGAVSAVFLFKDQIIGLASKQLKPPPITIDEKADYNWEVETPAGSTFDLRTLAGKPVFLHLWSGECYSCLTELAGIGRLYGQFAGKGVEFLCIARAGIEEAPRAASEAGLAAPIYVYEGARPAPFDDDVVPATYIMAHDGRIVFKHLGSAQWDAPVVAELLERIAAP